MTRAQIASAIVFLLLGAAQSKGDDPRQVTILAWDNYVAGVNATVTERNDGSRSFLWANESPGAEQRLRDGQFVITNRNPRKVPQGMIHDWIGDMFIPDVSLEQVMQVVDSYDRYSDIFKPLIRKSSVVDRNGDTIMLNVLAVQTAFSVTAAVETVEQIQIEKPSSERVCITADSVHIQEIADYGRPSEHVFSEARRPGFVWRAFIVQRLEQRDGGVYVELETISLSRGIPWEVRWLIKPLTDDLPRQMMTDLLDETRTAVQRSVAEQ